MTDQQKIELMDNLLHDVLHSLDMTLYHIADPFEAGLIARDLNKYWDRFAEIHQGITP